MRVTWSTSGWLFRRLGISSIAALAAGSAFGHQASHDAFVGQALCTKGNGRVELILRTSSPLKSHDLTRLAKIGGYVYRNLPFIDAVAVSVPKRKLSTLLGYEFVSHASSDVTVRKTDMYTVESSGADVVWQQYGATGEGIGVAVVDSGIRKGNDLGGYTTSRIVASKNFVGDLLTTGDDNCGHGTHVAGIIAGDGKMSTGTKYFQTFYGIAPKAHLISARVLNKSGNGKVSNVLAGISWVITNKLLYNVRVLNLSIGHEVGESYLTDPLCKAVETAWKAGIVVVCAAGNEGREFPTETVGMDNEGFGTNYGSINSPGNSPYAITVGAMKSVDGNREHDTIATYSSRGPTRLDYVVKPDIVAAGNRIVSTLSANGYLDVTYRNTSGVPWREYQRTKNTGMSTSYFRMSGTSMAAPVVSGAAALMLDVNPLLTPDKIKARMMATADKWASPDDVGDMFTYGAGYLNIPAALQSSITPTLYARSPTAKRQDDGNVDIIVSQLLVLNLLLWGADIQNGDELWGERAMWGKNITGERAMWGKNTVEPNRAMWGKGFWSDTSSYSVNQACADLTAISLQGEP